MISSPPEQLSGPFLLAATRNPAPHPASHLVSFLLVAGIIVSLLGLIFYLRWRAKNPLAPPESIDAVINDQRGNDDDPPSSGKDESPRFGNERDSRNEEDDPADWWKKDPGP